MKKSKLYKSDKSISFFPPFTTVRQPLKETTMVVGCKNGKLIEPYPFKTASMMPKIRI